MRRLRWFPASLVAVGVLLAIPPLALAQVLPGWDFSVSGFGGGAFPLNSNVTLSTPGGRWPVHPGPL